MVLEEGTIQGQYDNIELSLSEHIKQDFYKQLKDTNAYEQWRANIHRQLEEDLQRQVQQVLEETERQERLAKLRRQYIRNGQRLSTQQTETTVRQNDQRNEIDQRNQRLLYPLNAKETYGTQDYFPTFNNQRNKLTSNSFNLESYNNYSHHQNLSQRNAEHSLDNSTIYFQKHSDKQTLLTSNSAFLYGNCIIKTNKTEILNILDQQSANGENANTYVNKNGILIDEYGPFWPRDFRILHPTPKLFSRKLTSKEFYLIVTNSSLSRK